MGPAQPTRIWNWGIIGLGSIAHKFARDLAVLPNARLHAVASRSPDKAAVFGREYGARHTFAGHEDIVHCPDLDVVYIATPHVAHHGTTLHCLRNGLPVLCEKPLAMNARQVDQMVAIATDRSVFLMEALWTRFMPTVNKALALIENRVIGGLVSIRADFGFRSSPGLKPRLYDPALGGGALLDIGIYPVFLALLLLGRPSQIEAAAHLGATGVDEDIDMVFRYPHGRQARLEATIRKQTATEAFIQGSTGTLRIHAPWHGASSLSLLRDGQTTETFHFDYPGEGYYLEAAHVMECLDRKRTESHLLPLDFSRQLIRLLDTVRDRAGIHYPDIDNARGP